MVGSGAVRIPVAEIATLTALHQRLLAADFRYAKPGLEDMPWGTRELRLGDPAGNRLVFFADLPASNNHNEETP